MSSSAQMVDAQNAVTMLLRDTSDQLYIELGLRLQLVQRNPTISGSFMPPGSGIETYGPVDDLRLFGKRFLIRINTQLYELICGQATEEAPERTQVLTAFNTIKDKGQDIVFATLLNTILIGYFGLAPAIAIAVATLITVLLIEQVTQAAHGALCDVWATKLGTLEDGTE